MENKFAHLHQVMQAYVDEHKLAGLITMLAQRGQVVHFECFGKMDLDPLTPYLKGHGFGLGVTVLTDVSQSGMPGSEGAYWWGGAANTYFWIDPEEGLIGITLPQLAPVGHYPFQEKFKVLSYQAIGGA